MTEQQQIYMRKIQDFQAQIDALSEAKAARLAVIPKDQFPSADTAEHAQARKDAHHLAGQIGDMLLEMQRVQALMAGLNGVAKPEAPMLFTVQGFYGPMTIRLTYCGRSSTCDPAVTEEEARELSLEHVQEWYNSRGWPRNGMMQTWDKRRRSKGLFRLEVG